MDNATQKSRLQSLLRRWRSGRRASEDQRLAEADETGHVEMSLGQMRPGEFGHVLSICTECDARPHLLELGFTKGVAVEVVRLAPLGDPMTVRVRGYLLSLRHSEAEAIWMRRCPPDFEFNAADRGE
ncbi:MAG: ferrous iron transport protein A [Armatimonadota bacterium]|nr:ferrous iron transport protein A [Armatimonadota bacterium]